MPIVTIHLTEGFESARKTELLQASSRVVEETLAAPRASIRVLLHELAAEHVMLNGEVGVPLVQYQVFLIAGRPPELKAALIAALNAAARTTLGLAARQVRVLVSDIAKTDIGLDDGVTALAAGR